MPILDPPIGLTSPPVCKLTNDVLFFIFSINADMADDILHSWVGHKSCRALHVTRHTSQVSRHWRKLILESPTIWAGVIDLELFQPSKENWREEVFRRCGRCLLSVKGMSSFKRDSSTSTDKDALIKFFDTYWDRIKNLHVEVAYADLVNDETWLGILCQPARFLYSFHLQLQFFDDEIHQLFPSPHNPDTAPFSSVAPVLHRFYFDPMTSFLAFRVPWLSQLRALELNLTWTQNPRATIIEIFDLLENLCILEVLKISTDYSPLPPGTDKRIRQIELPRLHRLGINFKSLDDCIYFLEHITPNQKCTLSLRSKDATIFQPPDEKCDEKVTLLAEQFSVYAKALDLPDAQVLSLYVSSQSLEFTIYCKSWNDDSYFLDALDKFYMKLQVEIRNFSFPLTVDFLPILRSIPSSSLAFLKTFDLNFPWGAPLQFHDFLASLLSVETLIASNNTIMHLLQCSRNSTAIFPSLHTLRMRLEIGGVFTAHGIKDFLQWRIETGRAIEILDLSLAHDAYEHDFGFLEEMTDLRVRWEYRDEVHEYVCGTGSPEKLDLVAFAAMNMVEDIDYLALEEWLDDLENGLSEDQSHENTVSEDYSDESEWPI